MPSLIVKRTLPKVMRIKSSRVFQDLEEPEPVTPEAKSLDLVELKTDSGSFLAMTTEDPDEAVLVVPDPDGKLYQTNARFTIGSEPRVVAKGVEIPFRKISRFELPIAFDDVKAVREIRDGDGNTAPIVDYRGVTVEGMASTFNNVTPADREGDAILPGAFDRTLPEFRKNPVMLTDHRNSVFNIAGSFTKLATIETGLAVTGLISDAPDMISVRFKVMEKHLRAFSIGGFFFFQEGNYHNIELVDLLEISLVAIPANPDALFSSRSIDIVDAIKGYNRHKSKILQTYER